ncbi:ultraviolet-B receptor UVR8 [Acrasis kona]|uniref:Ultraviolet-B receptor n=1 Tax=Acrasis kona TaxID=1008807 RepID=A0AAW2ZNJ8_9EUKA
MDEQPPVKVILSCGLNSEGQLCIGGFDKPNPLVSKVNMSKVFQEYSSRIMKISCGDYHTIILTSDGTVIGMGRSSEGQLGSIGLYFIPRVINGFNQSIHDVFCFKFRSYFITKNPIMPQVLMMGSEFNKPITNTPTPIDVKYFCGEKVKCIAGGALTTLFLTNRGNVYLIQCYMRGQPDIEHPTQIQMPSKTTFTQIACGNTHNVLLASDGAVYSFGVSREGALGTACVENLYSPMRMKNLDQVKIISISCGFRHTVLLSSDQRVYATGDNVFGQICINPIQCSKLSCPTKIIDYRVKSIFCSSFNTLLVTSGNEIMICGMNEEGQCGVPRPNHLYRPNALEHYDRFGKWFDVSAACGHRHIIIYMKDAVDIVSPHYFNISKCLQDGLFKDIDFYFQ